MMGAVTAVARDTRIGAQEAAGYLLRLLRPPTSHATHSVTSLRGLCAKRAKIIGQHGQPETLSIDDGECTGGEGTEAMAGPGHGASHGRDRVAVAAEGGRQQAGLP